MKWLLILVLTTPPLWATQALVGNISSANCGQGTQDCNMSRTSIGQGNIISVVLTIREDGTYISSVTDTGGSSYTVSTFDYWSGNAIQLAYTLDAQPCASSCQIQVHLNRTVQNVGYARISAQEISHTGTIGTPIEGGGHRTTCGLSVACAGVTLTLTGGDTYAMVQGIATSTTSGGIGISSPWSLTSPNGYQATGQHARAALLNTTDNTAPGWTRTEDGNSNNVRGIAFPETAAAPATRRRVSAVTE